MAIKVKEGEDLSPSNVQRVIDALNAEQPITKKAACEMLHIAYNTTRLTKIIDNHNSREAFAAKLKKQMRNQPLDQKDKQTIVQSYLSGSSIAEIAESIYRSSNVVKNVLKQYNIPIRNKAISYFDPVFLQDGSNEAEDYNEGDLVFAARYNCPAYIKRLVEVNDSHGSVYSISLLGDQAQNAYQPYYELSDLRKLQKELSIKVHEMDRADIIQLINEGLRKANKRIKKASND